MEPLAAAFNAVRDGDTKAAQSAVKAVLDAGIPAEVVLKPGPALLKPQMAAPNTVSATKVVLGTVRGDLHDIGKNLVGIMFEGAGFEATDLGTDVSPERFV